jgi:hypothetical protein
VRSPFARRANDTRTTSLLRRTLMSLGVVISKDFWLTCACAEEVKCVVAASSGAGRPKNQDANSERVLSEVSDVLRWVACGPQGRSAAWFSTYETRVLCLRSSAVNAGDSESM